MPRTLYIAVAILLFAAFVGGVVSAASPSTALSFGTRASVTGTWLTGWPMVGHDPQRTNRSLDRVSLPLRLLWVHKGFFAPIVGADGSVAGWGSRGLTRLDAAGQVKWSYAASSDGPQRSP